MFTKTTDRLKFYYYYDEEKRILHREDGPAIEYHNGDKIWYLNGVRHREDGPAIEFVIRYKEWRKHDKLHREDGPAREYPNGNKEWWFNGVEYSCSSNEEWIMFVKTLIIK